MTRLLVLIMLIVFFAPASPVFSQNPFTSKPTPRQTAPAPSLKSPFFEKLVLLQHQLRQKMAELIREAKGNGDLTPLLLLLGLAVIYGAVHAAGPGHGKFVAASYVLTHNTSIFGGLIFGLCTALLHAFSGVIGVMGLRYVIQRGVSDTLAAVTTVTQTVSFGLIAFLGLGIFLKHGYSLFFAQTTDAMPGPESQKRLLPWAISIGLVPCPAVVMVMLFCLSMEVMVLGLLMAACISLGMAITISSVVILVVMGKDGFLNVVPKERAEKVEGIVGVLSGAVITVLGTLFLIATIGSI